MPRTLLLVVGPGRSGTSLFSAICQRLGCNIPQPEVTANETNPKGFGEPQWVVDFQDSLLQESNVLISDARPAAWDEARTAVRGESVATLTEWLADQSRQAQTLVIKDPRSLWFLDLWKEAARRCDLPMQYVTVLRHPAAVVRSREKAYGSRNPASGKAAVWMNTMLGTEALTRGRPRAFVRFDDLMSDWSTAIDRLAGQLDITALQSHTDDQVRAVEQLIDRSLRSATASWDGLDVPPRPRELADAVWQQVEDLVDHPDGEGLHGSLDGLRTRYRSLYEEAESIATSTTRAARREARIRTSSKTTAPTVSVSPQPGPSRSQTSNGRPSVLRRVVRSVPKNVRYLVPHRVRRKMLDALGRAPRASSTTAPAVTTPPTSAPQHPSFRDPHASWRRRQALALEAIEASRAPAFRIPDGALSWRVAVPDTSRPDLLQAMAALAPPELRLQALGAGKGPDVTVRPTQAAQRTAVKDAPMLSLVFADEVCLDERLSYACRIEFWQDRGEGVLEAVRANATGVKRVETSGSGMPSDADALPRISGEMPLWDEITFPIDAVFLWVDDSDPEWRARRDQHLGQAPGAIHQTARDASRFESRDELRYALRSVWYHAPWINHIHLVTAGQRPDWLSEDTPNISVVDHTEIFPPDALPTFNSNAIISRLHHIPGLQEHYILFNDDVFLGRPVPPERFFLANGMAYFYYSKAKIPDVPREDEPPLVTAWRATRNEVARAHGVRVATMPPHTPHPQLKSLHHDLEKFYPDWYASTARNRFRHRDDLEPLLLHRYTGFFSHRAVPGPLDSQYGVIGRRSFPKVIKRLRNEPGAFDSFCLNDTIVNDFPKEDGGKLLVEFLQERFPEPAPWETN